MWAATTVASKARSKWVQEFYVSFSEIVYAGLLRLVLAGGRWGARTVSLLTCGKVSPSVSGADKWYLWQLRALVRVFTSAICSSL